ncbi:MAG TPA: hypothetical protein VLR94_05605, partial [Acidobacteriota bacterium]|nr:hypothetical protein [Acidobacteriota bacterium]
GEVVITRYSDYQGKYTIDGLADGTYYVMATGIAGYIDQLYNGVPCPDGTCSLSAGTPVSLVGGSTANGINFPLTTDACMYCDDFEDGQLPDWTYLKPDWSETGGNLVGTPAGKKAMAVAAPAFQGCSICAIDMTVQISGGAQSKVWLMGWYSGKSTVELLMKGDKNRWILKERVGGSLVQKAKSVKTIVPNTPYRVHMVFDGVQVKVFVDDMVNPLITITPKAPPSGSFGLAVKGTIASFGYLDIN